MSLCDWTGELTPTDSLRVLTEIATVFAHRAGPGREYLLSLLERGDFAGILATEVPYNTLQPHQAIAYRQVLGLFSKLEFLEVGIDKEAVAFGKFSEAESLCRVSNEMFHRCMSGTFQFRPAVMSAFLQAKREIRRILGRCPSLAELDIRFGPGATTSTRRQEACPIAKMACPPSCSEDLLASGRLPAALREVPHWTAAHASGYSLDDDGYIVEYLEVTVQPGKLVFVPKTAKTHRSIVVEPSLNTLFQAGLGDFIARRLKRFGVDITDQRPNQVLAREGSLYGTYATIDLSSASDTISKGLCRFLLPSDWFALLSAFRSSKVEYRGELIDQEKFCSMGNGFTFPLETLLFYALARAVCTDVRAYGDDIICRSECFEETCEVLVAAGFVVNHDKSFGAGDFRESCGADYFRGINVRPFYQKHLVSCATLFTMHNFFYRNLDEEACRVILSFIPVPIRIYGPDGYGDGHLVSDEWSARRLRKHSARGYGGLSFETYTRLGRSFRSPYPGDYISPLYSIYVSSSDDSPGVVRSDGIRQVSTLPGTVGYKRSLIYYFG